MIVEIEISRCRFCRFFNCETADGMDFLSDDETYCDVDTHNVFVKDDDSCKNFELCDEVIKELKSSYGKKFVKVKDK
jgi:hypothetical protein